jgi:hypothetical protein
MNAVSQSHAVIRSQFASNLLASVRYPFSSPNNALGIGVVPQNFTNSFQLHLYILEMPHMYVLRHLQIWPYFISLKQINV